MPGTTVLRVWLTLDIVCLWVSLLSELCHAVLLAPAHHPENVLHSLHAGLIMAIMSLVALCATRLAYCAFRAHRDN